MALFHTTVVDNQIKALDTIGSVSGAVATFDTDRAENLVNLEVAIVATQSGSGTPSPSNPRTINGFSACNLSVNGTTETISFGQTVYGGRLNVGSGVLTVTHAGQTFTSVISGDASSTASWWAQLLSSGAKKAPNNNTKMDVIATYLNTATASQIINTENDIIGVNTNGAINIKIQGMISVADYNTYLSNNPLFVVYELETHFEIQLDSKQIQTIANSVNNIYADTGDIIDLKFILTVGQAIN